MQANSFDAENNLGSSDPDPDHDQVRHEQFHGSGEPLFTNQDLQAAPDFRSVIAPFSRKDLVGTLGGPIIRNKAFFFADVEKLWAKNPEAAGQGNVGRPEFDTWATGKLPIERRDDSDPEVSRHESPLHRR